MKHETETVRMKDLKPGDEFIRLGKQFVVAAIKDGRLCYNYFYKTSFSNNCYSVGANSNERVLKIIE